MLRYVWCYVNQAERVPWWMGPAWPDPVACRWRCTVLGVNVIAAWLRRAFYAVFFLHPTSLKHAEAEAYERGLKEGREFGRSLEWALCRNHLLEAQRKGYRKGIEHQAAYQEVIWDAVFKERFGHAPPDSVLN